MQLKDQEWTINLRKNRGRYVYFQMKCSPKRKRVIRNAALPAFGTEETKGGFPFTAGARFTITISVTSKCFNVSVNGKKFTTFDHRVPYQYVDRVTFTGDVIITKVEKVTQKWSPCSANCVMCKEMRGLTEAQSDIHHMELEATREVVKHAEVMAAKRAKKARHKKAVIDTITLQVSGMNQFLQGRRTGIVIVLLFWSCGCGGGVCGLYNRLHTYTPTSQNIHQDVRASLKQTSCGRDDPE